MKLFFSPGACSLAPHIVLREAGGLFSLEKVDLAKHVTASGADYYAINSKGQVPFLQLDDGSFLSEGPVIAQYIADQAAANGPLLSAAGSMARYHVVEWQSYISSELHQSFSPLFNPALDAVAKATHAGQLRKKFEWVDSQLAGKSYLTGNDFTVADAYLFTVAGWAKHVAMDLSDLAHLQAYLARVLARPAVQAALKAEGLVPA